MSSFQTIPVVDIAHLGGADTEKHKAVVDEIRKAAENVGFLTITGHGIDPAIISELIAATKAFFALSEAEKMKVYIGNSANHRGYVPEGEEVFASVHRQSDLIRLITAALRDLADHGNGS